MSWDSPLACIVYAVGGFVLIMWFGEMTLRWLDGKFKWGVVEDLNNTKQ